MFDEAVDTGPGPGPGPSTSTSSSADAEQTVPDDLCLPCNCHFHWECLVSAYSYTSCPNCGAQLLSTSPATGGAEQILCTYHNEGGVQQGLDILPQLKEESYFNAYPEERKAYAFLEFCREGDVPALVEMLQDDDDDDDGDDGDGEQMTGGSARHVDILRYQDPLGTGHSALHAAVSSGHESVAWLLLLLASQLDTAQFPQLVLQEATMAGVARADQTGKTDIRSLRDTSGRTAEEVAADVGGVWSNWLGTGRLAV